MDLKGEKNQSVDKEKLKKRQEKAKKRFKQLYENADISIDGEMEKIVNAEMLETGIVLTTKNHEVEIEVNQ